MSSGASNSTISALTSIRFFAALSVVLAHFGTVLFAKADPTVFRFFHSGGSAVMFFFVLSGFIISYVSWDRNYDDSGNKKKYFIARFARIAPLYYFSLAIGFANLLMKGFDGFSLQHVLIGLGAKVLFLHGFFPKHVYEPSWAIATWSLSVEAVFYLLVPFVWGYFRKLADSKLVVVIVVSLLAIAALGPLIEASTSKSIATWTWYVNPVTYLGFFSFGFGCCALAKQKPDLIQAYWKLLLITGFVGIVLWRSLPETPRSISLVTMAILSGLLILGLLGCQGKVRDMMSGKTIVLLGEASYALYLLHGPIHSFLKPVLAKLKLPPVDASYVSLAVYLALCLLGSVLAYKYIEIPARYFITRRFGAKAQAKV